MRERQTIWVESRATRFVALCNECLSEPHDPRPLAYRQAKFAGSLHPDADVGFCRCNRGHRLSIRRTTHPLPLQSLQDRQAALAAAADVRSR